MGMGKFALKSFTIWWQLAKDFFDRDNTIIRGPEDWKSFVNLVLSYYKLS